MAQIPKLHVDRHGVITKAIKDKPGNYLGTDSSGRAHWRKNAQGGGGKSGGDSGGGKGNDGDLASGAAPRASRVFRIETGEGKAKIEYGADAVHAYSRLRGLPRGQRAEIPNSATVTELTGREAIEDVVRNRFSRTRPLPPIRRKCSSTCDIGTPLCSGYSMRTPTTKL